MMKSQKLLPLLLLAVLVSGCSYVNSKLPANLPTQREQLCSELKRNIIFNSTSDRQMGAASATQRAQTMRLYDKNNCGNFEKK